MIVEIDKYSGFCFGVTNAIKKAEEILGNNQELFCLGHIVHNSVEEKRLNKLGLKSINHKEFDKIYNNHVLIRAHGEPPATYLKAKKNNIIIHDSTCPVVLNLQKKIKKTFTNYPHSLIIIYGKKGHAEVNGLVGQTNNKAIVISNINEAKDIDVKQKIFVFAQTTANEIEFNSIIDFLRCKAVEINGNPDNITFFNSICPSVRSRVPKLIKFVKKHDVIVFVTDKKSSNGRMLFEICKKHNPESHFITGVNDIAPEWYKNKKSVGISGATSTPLWLMEKVKKMILK